MIGVTSVPDIITPAQADFLGATVEYKEFDDPIVAIIVDAIRDVYPRITLEHPSYVRNERRPQGHPWHTDAGNKHGGTRGWCRVTATVLLTRPGADFDGGGFFFKEDHLTPVFNYCQLNTFRSDLEHCVASHDGDRRCLLMFFGEDDG